MNSETMFENDQSLTQMMFNRAIVKIGEKTKSPFPVIHFRYAGSNLEAIKTIANEVFIDASDSLLFPAKGLRSACYDPMDLARCLS